MNYLIPWSLHWFEVPFSNGSGSKIRPALVLSTQGAHVTVCPLYSRPSAGRRPFRSTPENGLNKDSYIQLVAVRLRVTRARGPIGTVRFAEFGDNANVAA